MKSLTQKVRCNSLFVFYLRWNEEIDSGLVQWIVQQNKIIPLPILQWKTVLCRKWTWCKTISSSNGDIHSPICYNLPKLERSVNWKTQNHKKPKIYPLSKPALIHIRLCQKLLHKVKLDGKEIKFKLFRPCVSIFNKIINVTNKMQ